ncbi:hypothetical protein F090043F1_18180 [Parabacteroides goldsteinii]
MNFCIAAFKNAVNAKIDNMNSINLTVLYFMHSNETNSEIKNPFIINPLDRIHAWSIPVGFIIWAKQ